MTPRDQIALFSMEIGLTNDFKTYSGGLGVLVGDMMRTSADLELPMVAITLVSKKGYGKQRIVNGKIESYMDEWDPSKHLILQQPTVNVTIQNRPVKVKAWTYELKGLTGGLAKTIFLDTDLEANDSSDRELTSFLYGGDERYRLKQEMVLGIGGVKILDALGICVRKYHMNEGHCSLLALELLRRNNLDANEVKKSCVFTTHTPVEYGHDRFSYEVVKEIMGDFVPLDILKSLGGQSELNLSYLALNLSSYVNGVSQRHKEVLTKMFPQYKVNGITNGVHSYTWTDENFRKIFDKYVPEWVHEPEQLKKIDAIPDEEIWQAHLAAKKKLIDYVNDLTKAKMDYHTLTIGFARRATPYKRATLIFSDLERLKKISKKGKIQLIFAGKAHIKDESGKKIIQEILDCIDKLKSQINIVYLEDYDLGSSSKMVSGVDVWLNTPTPPLEASGTSGMKAAHNGVINFSVLDGWWIEGWIEDRTGWAIGPHPIEECSPDERKEREINDLYNKLEYIIIPKFYSSNGSWINMMKSSIGNVASYFNTHRMMRQYVTEAYFR